MSHSERAAAMSGDERRGEDALIEALADKEHASWARWMEYLFSKCSFVEGGILIPGELVTHWARQVSTSYADLTEREKQSDRDEVAHILPIIEAWASEKGGGDGQR